MYGMHDHDLPDRREDERERDRNRPDTYKERKEDAQAVAKPLDVELKIYEAGGVWNANVVCDNPWARVEAEGESEVAAKALLAHKLMARAKANSAMMQELKKVL